MKRTSYYLGIGDAVRYLHDDGKTFTTHVITDTPTRLNGELVVWISGMSGCVLADRCTPVRLQPPTDEEYSKLGPRQLDELGDDE